MTQLHYYKISWGQYDISTHHDKMTQLHDDTSQLPKFQTLGKYEISTHDDMTQLHNDTALLLQKIVG